MNVSAKSSWEFNRSNLIRWWDPEYNRDISLPSTMNTSSTAKEDADRWIQKRLEDTETEGKVRKPTWVYRKVELEPVFRKRSPFRSEFENKNAICSAITLGMFAV